MQMRGRYDSRLAIMTSETKVCEWSVMVCFRKVIMSSGIVVMKCGPALH